MKHIILFTFSLITLNFIGQNTILSEDFNEGFPAGWQLVDNDGLTPNASPAVNFIDDAFVVVEDYDSTGVGDSILVATSWFDTIGEADDWLILPNLTMGNFGNYISFDAKSMDASHPDGLEIRVSTGGPNLWEFFSLDTVAYANVAMAPTWTNYTVTLDHLGIAGKDVFIAFKHISTDDYILGLDNIVVRTEDPVSIPEANSTLQIYPNPSSNGIFQLSENFNGSFEVYNVTGKIVMNGALNSNVIDLSSLEFGCYWIKLGEMGVSPVIIQ